MNITIKLFLIITLITFSNVASAFDGERNGFVLGLGIGYHKTDINGNFSEHPGISANESPAGFATSFRLGLGLSSQAIIYYINDINWYNEDSEGDLTIVGISGFGFSYYFSRTPGSLYLTTAFGAGVRNETSDSQAPVYSGVGYSFGIGYEFVKWVSLQFDYQSMSLKHQQYNDITKDVKAMRLMLQTNFY